MTTSGVYSRAVPTPKPRYFYGWTIVATAALGLFLGAFPIVVISFGVFTQAYFREYHASRAAISLAFTIQNLTSALLAVVIGRLADRLGARRVILPGLLMLGLLLISAEAIGTKIWHLYVFYFALGAVGSATNSVPYGMVVSRWFDRRRGLALGVMMIGLGAGSVVMPPVAEVLIATYGWRSAFAILGCAVLTIPMAIVGKFLKESPEQIGLLPDGALSTFTARREPEGLTWREIRRRKAFWLMIAAFALVAAGVHGCIVHLPQLMADRGANARGGALAISLAGIGLLTGRVGTGYFLDRCFGPSVAVSLFVLTALGIGFLWTASPGVPAFSGAFLVGLGLGAEVDIIVYLMSRYFGLRSLGTAFGFGFGAFVLAGGLGPLIMGFAADRTGSYGAPLGAFVVATALAAVLVSRLGPYAFGKTEEAQVSTGSAH